MAGVPDAMTVYGSTSGELISDAEINVKTLNDAPESKRYSTYVANGLAIAAGSPGPCVHIGLLDGSKDGEGELLCGMALPPLSGA